MFSQDKPDLFFIPVFQSFPYAHMSIARYVDRHWKPSECLSTLAGSTGGRVYSEVVNPVAVFTAVRSL